jgi:hypothetical protein
LICSFYAIIFGVCWFWEIAGFQYCDCYFPLLNIEIEFSFLIFGVRMRIFVDLEFGAR